MSDELLDIVDDDDHVTGQAQRSLVHQRGLQHRGVHVFLVTPQGKLIVQVRSSTRSLCPLALDGSLSEHVKAGENYREAARRGLVEELGLPPAVIHPLVKFRLDYAPGDREMCTLYEGKVDPAMVKIDLVEVERIEQYGLDELFVMKRSGQVLFCGWFVELLNWYAGEPTRLKVCQTYTSRRLLRLPD